MSYDGIVETTPPLVSPPLDNTLSPSVDKTSAPDNQNQGTPPDTALGQRVRSSDEDFYKFASRSMDKVVLLGMICGIIYLVAVSANWQVTLAASVVWTIGNIIVTIKVRRAERPVGFFVGLARSGLALVCVPIAVYSTGGAPLSWIIAMPLLIVLIAYFPFGGRILLSLSLMSASLIPHHLNQPAGTWDLSAVVILAATPMFSIPLWTWLERDYHRIFAMAQESAIIARRKAELLHHQGRLHQGLVVSCLLFIAGVLATLIVYQRIGVSPDTDLIRVVQEHNILAGRLWLFLGAITSLSLSSLVFIVYRDRGYLDALVQRRTWELEEANHAIEAATRAKSLFLANMSHEIRTPMNGVIGTTDVLLMNEADPEKREMLEIIKSSGESMMSIIDDVLDLSKIESGKLQIDRRDFNLHRCLQLSLRSMQFFADSKSATLHINCEDSVPALVHTDELRMRQILLNLVSNAIKFSEGGDVVVSARADDKFLHFEVSDNGVGISAEDQKRLFQAFEQADASTTRKFGGTGLGLAICKQLCTLLDGDISVESEPGKGSTFRFHISYQPARAAEITAASQPEGATEPSGRALLAEDNVISQRVAKRLLERHFAEVMVAASGQEALNMAIERKPDIIFMDVHMPEMDGLEVTSRLLDMTAWRRVPIIALTASAFPEDRQRCLDSGMTDFISKPMKRTELSEIIRRNLAG